MYQSGVVFAFVILMILEILFNGCLCNESLTDFDCLQAVQDSFEDPLNSLAYTWDFTNTTEGSICNFTGVECWHPGESKVSSLKLSWLGLEGNFPFGIKYCSSLTGLDLSNNNFSGALPSNMIGLLPYVTLLDLSSNAFSGEIPASLSDSMYLNELNLENNFSGQIPIELTGLYRLKTFNVANNNLTGPIPYFSKNLSVGYADNPGHCGGILAPSITPAKKNQVIVVGLVTGAVVLVVIVIVGTSCYFLRIVFSKKRKELEGNV